MHSYVFVIALLSPVFGADIEVPVKASATDDKIAMDACWKARRAAQTMLRSMGVSVRLSECALVSPSTN